MNSALLATGEKYFCLWQKHKKITDWYVLYILEKCSVCLSYNMYIGPLFGNQV